MKTLTIYYDGECGLCGQLKAFFENLPVRERLEFIAYQSPEAEARMPGIRARPLAAGMLLQTPEGALLEGGDSWLRLVSATRHWAWLAGILGLPGLRSVVRAGYGFIAARRQWVSRILGLRVPEPGCGCTAFGKRPAQ